LNEIVQRTTVKPNSNVNLA